MCCAATTTIRRIVDDLTNPYWERLPGDNPQASTEVALASLEQVVEAAEVLLESYGEHDDVWWHTKVPATVFHLRAALSAVGPDS